MRDAWSAFKRNWWRLVFAAVGAVAAVVSYGHIVSLFLSWHATSLDAHLMPIAIDGLIIIGAGAAKSGQAWLGWSAIGPGLAASLYANVMNGLPYGRGAAMGSGWATVALFLATNVMERWKPAQVVEAVSAAPEEAPAPPAAVPAAPEVHLNGSGLHPAEAEPFAEDLARGKVPGIRRIRSELHVGQPRAQEVQARLAVLARNP